LRYLNRVYLQFVLCDFFDVSVTDLARCPSMKL